MIDWNEFSQAEKELIVREYSDVLHSTLYAERTGWSDPP